MQTEQRPNIEDVTWAISWEGRQLQRAAGELDHQQVSESVAKLKALLDQLAALLDQVGRSASDERPAPAQTAQE